MTNIQNFRQFVADAQNNDVPFDRDNPQTMLMDAELKLLYTLARDHFRNEGHIIDAGCFLGGSTCALARGLLDNPKYQQNPRPALIHSFDLFEVEKWTIGHYFPEETLPLADFEPRYLANVENFKNLLDVRKGDVTQEANFREMIEILFIDLAKTPEVCDHVNRMFFPALVPGHSIVIQQDYLYPHYTGHLHVTMEYLIDYFENIGDTGQNSVVYLYKKQMPQELLERDIIASLSLAEMYTLSKRAEARFTDPKKRAIIRQARGQYMDMMKTSRPQNEVRAYEKLATRDKWTRFFRRAA